MKNIKYPEECLRLFGLPKGEEALNAINYLWAQGVKTIRLIQEGEGDNGEYTDIDAYYEGETLYETNSLIRSTIEQWMWGVASDLSPGYEINDGGRVYVTLIKGNDTVELSTKCTYWSREEVTESANTYNVY